MQRNRTFGNRRVLNISGPRVLSIAILVAGVVLWIIGLRRMGAQNTDYSVTALGILVGGGWTSINTCPARHSKARCRLITRYGLSREHIILSYSLKSFLLTLETA